MPLRCSGCAEWPRPRSWIQRSAAHVFSACVAFHPSRSTRSENFRAPFTTQISSHQRNQGGHAQSSKRTLSQIWAALSSNASQKVCRWPAHLARADLVRGSGQSPHAWSSPKNDQPAGPQHHEHVPYLSSTPSRLRTQLQVPWTLVPRAPSRGGESRSLERHEPAHGTSLAPQNARARNGEMVTQAVTSSAGQLPTSLTSRPKTATISNWACFSDLAIGSARKQGHQTRGSCNRRQCDTKNRSRRSHLSDAMASGARNLALALRLSHTSRCSLPFFSWRGCTKWSS